MLTRFQQEKLTHYFVLFDFNNDGFVDFYDLLAISDKIAEFRVGEQIESDPLYWELYDYTNMRWRRIVDATPHPVEHGISVEDWLAFWNDVMPMLYERIVNQGIKGMDPIFQALCDQADPEQTGYIDIHNWSYFTSAHGILGSPVEMFLRLDVDGDGRISRDELQDMYHTFLFSDDPEEAGNYLFGVVYSQPSN